MCPALRRCPTLWATSISPVWVCVRRCSAVLPCGPPQYHKCGSVYGAVPLSYPVGHLSITSMGLCTALLGCPTLWATSISQVWVCVRRCSAVLPCGPPQYHRYGSVSGSARLSSPVGHLNITSVGLCPVLLRCPTLWATSISQVWVCVRRCSVVLPCGPSRVSQVWVCVRRCFAVLPCGPPQYHKYGSVSGAAPLSYPVGHLNITSVDWDADFVTADNAYSRYIHSRPRSQLCVRVPSCTLIGSTVLQVVLFSLSAPAA